MLISQPATAFYAGLDADPNPNYGDFVITSNIYGSAYKLQEIKVGEYTVTLGSMSPSYQILGRTPGDYIYRLSYTTTQCSGWPEPECTTYTLYSENLDVTVEAPPSQGGGDPFPAPGPFSPPSDADFPDAAVVNPSPPDGDRLTNSVGAVSGEGGVAGGQARYTIPIIVPPGRNGMQPDVSIEYSSSNGDGVLGVGWRLSAGSSITRCGATVARSQDGFSAAPQYDASRDRLCLDGQRLMVVNGAYGSNGAEYRTELDIFARIKQYGSINGTTTYFVVEFKDGRINEYGTNSNTRHKAQGRSETLAWALEESRDRSGNTINYIYFDHGNGEYNLQLIRYTATTSAVGDRRVRFYYEDRPDKRTRFVAGGKQRSTKRLYRIRTEYQSTYIRNYFLNYDVSQSTARSLLSSIKECGIDDVSQQHCLKPTEFEWHEGSTQFVTERLQFFDPDNHLPGGSPAIVHADKRWLHEVMPHGDQNGDGVKDWTDLYVNAEGEVTDTRLEHLANCFRPSWSLAMTCLQADFDADGRSDSFRSNNQVLEVRMAKGGQSASWVSTGVKWGDNGPPLGNRHDFPLAFADFNGDGWTDLAIKQNSELWVYFHTQSLTIPYSNSNRQWLTDYTTDASGYSDTTQIQVLGDMDGNGLPDFVVSRTYGGPSTPGLPVPDRIIQTHSQPGGSMTTTTRTFSNLVDDPNVNSHFFHDLNGDGLQDLLSLAPGTYDVQYRLNDGVSFPGAWKNLGLAIPTRSGTYQPSPTEWETVITPILSQVVVMDYNGDGIDDMLVANGVVASGCAESQQEPPLPPVWKCDDDLYGEYDESNPWTNYWPINSEEQDDSVRSFKAVVFGEAANGDVSFSEVSSTGIIGSATQTAVVDATGDGLPDIVTVLGCRRVSCAFNLGTTSYPGTVQNATYVEGAWINRNLGAASVSGQPQFDYQVPDLLSAVEDGYGNRDEWVYKPLSSDAYDRDSTTPFYETTHSYQEGDTDYFHFASSMHVVAEHLTSNGIGGMNSMLHRYRGAIFNNKGRGFQGFRSLIREQDIYGSGHALAGTDKITRIDYHQKWPHTSIVERSCTWVATDNLSDDNPDCSNLIAKSTTDSIHDVATSGGARFVAVETQTSTTYDLALHTLLTTVITDRDFDVWGNVTAQSRDHDDVWTKNLTAVASSYSPDSSTWWLDKLTSRAVTYNPVSQRHASTPTIAPTTDNTKTITTSFTQYDSAQRLPTVVTLSANDTPLTLTLTTGYTSYGLPSSIEVDGTDVTGPRTTTITYSKNGTTQAADGYFPFTVTNALGHETEQHTDPRYGQMTNLWDANDLQTTMSYDPFGRVHDQTGPGQPMTSIRRFWCDGAPACPQDAEFVVNAYAAGAPDVSSYIDALGRTIQTSSTNFSGAGVASQIVDFDERGLVTFQSAPYDPANPLESPTMGTRYLSYDALGRLTSKESDQPEGQVLLTNYVHDGFKTTINAAGVQMHRIFNGLGQLVETKDGENGYTRYAYDGAGNPILIQDPKMGLMNPKTAIYASFNALGFKEWVEDPNWWNTATATHGVKAFTYSAVGETLSESDPNGNLIEMNYDELGRLTGRSVNGDLVGTWVYDNADQYKGLGLLDYVDSQFRPDGSRHQKFYYYSPAASGRKDLLQVKHRFYESDDQYNYEEYDTALFTDSFYARPKGIRYPGGVGLAYTYNASGDLLTEEDPISSVVYREITGRNSRHQITEAEIGRHGGQFKYSYQADYFAETGQAARIQALSSGATIDDLFYKYDVFGNVSERRRAIGGTTTENLSYDDNQRLIQSQREFAGGGTATVDYDYDKSGNFIFKTDYASQYNYHSSRPHVLTSVTLTGGGSVTFDHDDNGNIIQGDGETITYDAFNKPLTISTVAGSPVSTFTYGADLLRYRQTRPSGARIYYLDGLMEIETNGSAAEYRHFLSDVAVLTKNGSLSDPSPEIRYVFRDRLGGVTTVANTANTVTETHAYGPFGKPRYGDWTDKPQAVLNGVVSDRGFTNHEHLDDWELIHMNGRAYDPNLGRFLSIDPLIANPGNSQAINPYSYIFNNPLSGTDPSGYSANCDGPATDVGCSDRATMTAQDTGEIARNAVDSSPSQAAYNDDSQGDKNGTGGSFEILKLAQYSDNSGRGGNRLDGNQKSDEIGSPTGVELAWLNAPDSRRSDPVSQTGEQVNDLVLPPPVLPGKPPQLPERRSGQLPDGLDGFFSPKIGSSFMLGFFGFSGSVGTVVNAETGETCLVTQVCGKLGWGLFLGVTGEVEIGEANAAAFDDGTSNTAGVFVEGASGLGAFSSADAGPNSTSVTVGGSFGAGVAKGLQMCTSMTSYCSGD